MQNTSTSELYSELTRHITATNFLHVQPHKIQHCLQHAWIHASTHTYTCTECTTAKH